MSFWEYLRYGLEDRDLNSILFAFDELYIDHIRWRILHHIFGQKCGNCRNWHFCGRMFGSSYGRCDLDSLHWAGYHDWCPVWNIDCGIDDAVYTECEDGCLRVEKLPSGKHIVQESKSGIWMYKKDGDEI